MSGDIIFRGQSCYCVRTSVTTYQVCAQDGRVVGEIRWNARLARYTFAPEMGGSWTSTTLTEIALWLRRLNRLRGAETLR
jgi:hypothetical protein